MEKEEQQEQEQQEQQTFITDYAELKREKERERALEEKKTEIRAKKRKLIPPFVMLLAGAIVSITMFVSHYKSKDMLVILLCVLLGFYVAGEILKYMLDRFEEDAEARRREEGEVFEMGPDGASAGAAAADSAGEEPESGQEQTGQRLDDDEEELIF